MINNEWNFFRTEALEPLENFLTTGDSSKLKFSVKTYSDIYTRVYNLCITQVESIQAELYKRYTQSISEYLEKEVRPRLESLSGEILLKELHLRWENHKVMVRWMQRFFAYLDRYFVDNCSIANLTDQGFAQFKVIIFGRLQKQITEAVLE